MQSILWKGIFAEPDESEETIEECLHVIKMPQCESNTRSGDRCRNTCSHGKFCHRHSSNSDQCSICFGVMNESNSRKLDCGHTYHKQCIERWKMRSLTCPICRTPFDQPKYKVRVTIEPDGRSMETITSNISNLVDMFGLDNHHLEGFFTDIRFTVPSFDILNEVLRDIGFTSSNISSLDTVSTTEL